MREHDLALLAALGCFISGWCCSRALAARRHERDVARLERALREMQAQRDAWAQTAHQIAGARDAAFNQAVLERGRAMVLLRDKVGVAALYDN